MLKNLFKTEELKMEEPYFPKGFRNLTKHVRGSCKGSCSKVWSVKFESFIFCLLSLLSLVRLQQKVFVKNESHNRFCTHCIIMTLEGVITNDA